jgi:SAM-dependent methyltransferase
LQKPSEYTYGTSQEAASRLGKIGEFFNPLAARLITEYVRKPPARAIDLGCGPGFTTDMLYHAARAQDTYGMDSSPEHLARAKEQYPHCHFLEHNVTHTPFPLTADVMYVRFVLSHLPDPVKVVRSWVTQLNPGGILVIEEVEAVETEVDVFRRYLDTNEALVASQGARLFVGHELASRDYGADILLDDCAILPVSDSQAASWFLPNTKTIWRQSEVVSEHLTPAEIEAIPTELAQLAGSKDEQSHITWLMRRLVLMRHQEDNKIE